MSFGGSPFGGGAFGAGTDEVSTELALYAVEILSSNTLLLSFSEPLSGSQFNFSEDNYSIDSLTVRSVISPLNTVAATEVVLVTDKLNVGSEYVVSASNLESASGNVFNDTTTIEFTGRSTKLDKVLTSTPTLYDTSPDSAVRQILTAIHRENDKIGGTEVK